MRKTYYLFVSIVLALFFTACHQPNSSTSINDKVNKEITQENGFMDDLNNAKQVFYALPSPIETAMLIKRAGTAYDETILNPVQNLSNYTNSSKRALNFGVYGADLSYASLFEQTQTAIQYMATSKKLADDLGILDFLQADFVERLEKNVNNRDSVMMIITDGFMNSNTYLKEAGRPEIAALIIAGGWIEGLYIATRLTKESPNNNELIDRIIDQKLSLATLIKLLNDYNKSADVKHVYDMIMEADK